MCKRQSKINPLPTASLKYVKWLRYFDWQLHHNKNSHQAVSSVKPSAKSLAISGYQCAMPKHRVLLESHENTYSYQELLNAYSDVQVNLLKAVAKEKKVEHINSGEFIARYRLKTASSVSRALKKLVDNELIYKSGKAYCIYDKFFSLWLEKI